ncbi:MAG: DUF72 domain-containing protein [Brevefilum sp.]
MAQAWVGVSGWQYPDFSERFYPDNLEKHEQLAYYARNFPTVEINNTFYQLPGEESIERWRNYVPEDFLFSIKASRFITHMKNLLEPEETLPQFFERISLFGEKCGPILFQLPPHWGKNLERLQNFLPELPDGFRYAFELRNKSWLEDEIYKVLREHEVAFCIYEIDFRQSPILTTTDFVYIRLHGPGRAYNDPYDLEALGHWADRIKHWVEDGLDVYCYFDNTHRGYAWENAQTLLSLL